MQLDQPIPPAGNGSGQNPYDFILSGAPKKSGRSLLPSGRSKTQRIIFFIVGVVGIFIIFGIILTVISNVSKAGTKALVAITQTQTEIARVSNAASSTVRDGGVTNFNDNVTLVITTDQQRSVAYLTKHGQKMNKKTLALGHKPSTDAALATAGQNGDYDDVLLATLKQQLKDYQQQLSDAYKQSDSKSQKVLLAQFFSNADKLLKNAPTGVSP